MPAWFLLIAVLLLGLAGRVWLVSLSPHWGFPEDHFWNITMGLSAEKWGLFKIYSIPDYEIPKVSGRTFDMAWGRFVPFEPQYMMTPNYPPLGILSFWMQVKLLGAVASPVTGNTFVARLVMASVPVLAEIVIAVGVFLLVRDLYGKKAAWLAAAVCWLFPPLAMNASFWGQTDALVLAPMVFTVWLMLRRRWAAAGVSAAVALLLKPQGILLAPIMVFGAIAVEEPGVRAEWNRIATRLGQMMIAGAATFILLTLPWTLADGLAWFKTAYLSTLSAYPFTTLKAFNFWYLEALSLDKVSYRNILSSHAPLAGISKDLWGRLFMIASMAIIGGLSWRRYRRTGTALVLFSALWLWSIYIWPTRVHERYIVYCMPLMLVLAAGGRRFWPAVAGLMILGIAAHTWNVWLTLPADSFQYFVSQKYLQSHTEQREAAIGNLKIRIPTPTVKQYWQEYQVQRSPDRAKEYLAVAVSLFCYAWALAAGFFVHPTRPPSPSGRAQRYRRVFSPQSL